MSVVVLAYMTLVLLSIYCVNLASASVASNLSKLISSTRLQRLYTSKPIEADLAEIRHILSSLHYPEDWQEDVVAYVKAAHDGYALHKQAFSDLLTLNLATLRATAEKFMIDHERMNMRLVESTFPAGVQWSRDELSRSSSTARKDLRKISKSQVSPLTRAHIIVNLLKQVAKAGDGFCGALKGYLADCVYRIGDAGQVAKALITFDSVDHWPSEKAESLYLRADHAFTSAVCMLGGDKPPSANDLRRLYTQRELASHLDYTESRRISVFNTLAGKLFEHHYLELQKKDTQYLNVDALLSAMERQTRLFAAMNAAQVESEKSRTRVFKLIEEIGWSSDSPRFSKIPQLNEAARNHLEVTHAYQQLVADENEAFTKAAQELALLL